MRSCEWLNKSKERRADVNFKWQRLTDLSNPTFELAGDARIKEQTTACRVGVILKSDVPNSAFDRSSKLLGGICRYVSPDLQILK